MDQGGHRVRAARDRRGLRHPVPGAGSVSLLAELRRRSVIRVAGLYVVTAWLLVQVADTLLPIFGTPAWVLQALVVLLALGFIPALVVSWVFELTSEGIRRDNGPDAAASGVDRTARKLDMAVIMLLLGIGALVLWGQRSATTDGSVLPEVPAGAPATPATDADPPPPVAHRSIAVLPFDNLSSDPEQGYFADGLTEEILNALAAVPGLMVTARTSSFHYKDQDLPVDEIGERLGVEHLLEGSVRRSGDQLRVTAQLVRARDGFHLWSQAYDRDYSDAFAVQGDIAEQVATALGILLDDQVRARMAASGARDPEAYALFARGFELYLDAHNGAPQVPTLTAANGFFDQAVALAPGLWVAHYHSADLYSHILLNLAAGADPDAVAAGEEARALAELRRRLRAASTAAPNASARDFIQLTDQLFSDDWTGLGELLRRSYTRAESCGFHQWTFVGIAMGLAAQARGLFEQGIRCNALDEALWLHATRAAAYAGDVDGALALIDQGLARPELARGQARLHLARLNVLASAGRLDEARAEALRIDRASADQQMAQAWLAAMDGDEAALDALRAQPPTILNRDHRLEFAAMAGDRRAANAIAAAIDARPAGPLLLLNKIHFCMCGAPFDLEAAPNFTARLAESGLPWPPVSPVDWPLKAW